MKKFRKIMLFICIFTVVTSFAKGQLSQVSSTSDYTTLKYTFEKPEVKTENGITSVSVNGLQNLGDPGAPLLPIYSGQIVIPQGASVKSFRVEAKSEVLEGSYVIKHAEMAQPLSKFNKSFVTPRDESIYSLKSIYPSQQGYVRNVGKKFGYSILPFNLHPVRYLPSSGEIFYCTEMTVLIEFSYDKSVNGVLPRPSSEEQLTDIALITDDFSAIKSYGVASKISKTLSLPAASIDYMIIRPDSFEDNTVNALENFHRVYNGYTTTNITIEWIDGNYAGTRPDGNTDLQTKIRNFIKDAYYQWGVRLVVLVGDNSIIPARRLYATAGGENDEIPADMYYGCLDDTFDGNGNGVYGESTDGAGDGDIDLFAEVYVGRISASDTASFANQVNKILAYWEEDKDEYLRAVHMLGEYLQFGGLSDYAKGMMEQIRLGGTYDSYTTLGFADSAYSDEYDLDVNLYDEDGLWDKTELLSLMNEGTHIFNHLGHANQTYSMKLDVSDLDSLTNDKYFFIYSQGCMSGWFDDDTTPCFAQEITTMQEGAFGVIMNARYGWGYSNSTDGPSHRFGRWFWNYALGNYDALVGEGYLLEAGIANQLSKEKLVSQINWPCMRWVTYELNLFGDPAVKFRLIDSVSEFAMSSSYVNVTNMIEIAVNEPNSVDSNITISVESYDGFVSLTERGTLMASTTLDLPIVARSMYMTNAVLADLLAPIPVHGNTIVFTYNDSANPIDAQPVYFVMTVDNIPPVIDNIQVTDVSIHSAQISFTTDEPVTGAVVYDTSVAPSFMEAVELNTTYDSETGLINNVVKLTGLTDTTGYYFGIVADDRAGNESTMPADIFSVDPADYSKFITARLQYANESFDFTSKGPLGWTHGGLNDTWEYGAILGIYTNAWEWNGWQTGLNSPYESPCNTWLASPFITATDVQYMEVTYNLDLADNAYVIIEGYDGSGWRELDYMDVSSSKISEAMFDISDLDTSKPFKIRFRLFSQTGAPAAKGLSIFNIKFIKEVKNGVYINGIFVHDTPSLSPNNNGDGILDAGETANLEISAINLSQSDYSDVRAVIDLPGPGISVVGDNIVEYGDMDIGEFVTGANYVKVEALSTYNPSDETSYLFHTAQVAGTTNAWIDTYYLYIEGELVSVTGKVTDKTGGAISNAIVEVYSENGAYDSVSTLSDGTFETAREFTSGEEVVIRANATDYLENSQNSLLQATNYVEIALGQGYLSFTSSVPVSVNGTSPLAISGEEVQLNLTVSTDGYAKGEFPISNIGGDSDISFDLPGFTNDNVAISFDAEVTTLAVGETTTVTVEAFAKDGYTYTDETILCVVEGYDTTYLVQNNPVGVSNKYAKVWLNLSYDSYKLSGIVKDKQGNPVSGMYVVCRELVDSDVFADSYVTDSTGYYEFPGLAPNTYHVDVVNSNYLVDASNSIDNEFRIYSADISVVDADVTHDVLLRRAYADIVNLPSFVVGSIAQGQTAEVPLEIANMQTMYTADSTVNYKISEPVFLIGNIDVDFSKREGQIAALGTDTVTMSVGTDSGSSATNYFYFEVSDSLTGELLDQRYFEIHTITTNGAFMSIVGSEVEDSDNNDIIEPGEVFTLTTSLKNESSSNEDAVNIEADVSVVSGACSVLTNVLYASTCASGQTILPLTNAVLQVDANAEIGDEITLLFSLAWDDSVWGTHTIEKLIHLEVGNVNEVYFDPAAIVANIYESGSELLTVNIVNDTSADLDFKLKTNFEEAKLVENDTDFVPIKCNWEKLDAKSIVSGRLLIRPKDGESLDALELRLITEGYTIISKYNLVPGLLVQIPDGNSLATSAQTLETWENIFYVEPEYVRELTLQVDTPYRVEPNDPDLGYLWGLYNNGYNLENYISTQLYPITGDIYGTPFEDINAREAWYMTTGSKDVKVCIMDTGIYRSHEDLKDNLWVNEGEMGIDANGFDKSTNGIDDDNNGAVDDINGATFLTSVPNGNFTDDNMYGHGTHVAGTVGAVGNNGIGISGINWDVSLVGAKVGDMSGSVYASAYWSAIEYCAVNDIDLVNMSFGGSGFSSFTYELMEAAGESNVLFVCAAGNSGLDNDIPGVSYPASYDLDNIIAVAAHDNNGFLADFSNYGETSVDISAPGVDVYSTVPGMLLEGSYGVLPGTSMASPHVTGVAALLKSIAPDAPYTILKQAILDSAVKSHKLEGKVVTSGYLNAYEALKLLKTYWIDLITEEVTVSANGQASIDMIINPNTNMVAGEVYIATIVAENEDMSIELPVKINMIPSVVLKNGGYEISGGDNDGIIEPGETVSLTPYILNDGSLMLMGGLTVNTISFSEPGVSASGSLSWSSIISTGDSVPSESALAVTFPAVCPSTVIMSVEVTYNDSDRGMVTKTIDFELDVDSEDIYSVSGQVLDKATGLPVANATIQYFGQNTGFVTNDASGSYTINGIANGDLTLKVYKEGYAVSEQQTATVNGTDVVGIDFELSNPVVSVTASASGITMLKGSETQVTVTLENTSDYDWSTPVRLLRKPKLALISDGTQLEDVKDIVENIGYECDVLNNNIGNGYTLDSGLLSKYDVLILDLTGSDGSGRVLSMEEYDVLYDYEMGRGSIIITGANPFNSPDNYYLASLLNNFVNRGLQEDVAAEGVSYTRTRPMNSIYGVVPSGSKVVVEEKNYDNLLVNSAAYSSDDHNSSVDNLVMVNGASKIAYFDAGSEFGFGNYVWTGNSNGGEWTSPTILQDVFKNILFELAELRVTDEAVIEGGLETLNLPAGASDTITLTFEAPDSFDYYSTNSYTLLFANGLEINDFSKVIDFEVSTEPYRFTAKALGGVTNWLGEALQGDGSENSAIYQLIYAGPDGLPDDPASDGGTTGDDEILLRTVDGTSFGYFGYGQFAYPDYGRFIDEFSAFGLSAGDIIYVRAWDSSSVADSVAYGDSATYAVNYIVDEEHDFGAWAVSSVINYPGTYGMQPSDFPDKNQDSIVDGFAVKYGFDATAPIVPLTTTTNNNWDVNAIATSEGLIEPTRLTVGTNGYIYVVDAHNDRIAIYDEGLTLIKTYANAQDPFNDPHGIEYDELTGKLIVADTDNNRIVLIDVQDGTNLTWNSSFGSSIENGGTFNKPYAVNVGPNGNIYVADSNFGVASDVCHNRISIFDMNGNLVGNIGDLEASDIKGYFNKPLGLTFDDAGRLYVADYENKRIQGMLSNGSNPWEFELPQFSSSRVNGAQELSVVSYRYNGVLVKQRLFILDYNNNYVLVYGMNPLNYGTLVLETVCGMYGSQPGYLFQAQGIVVKDGSVYIADTGNGRIQKLEIVLDLDQDGMEDTWEDVHGLDSSVNDAFDDPDGDGLYNIGEYRIGTEPMNPDTDGDGVSDGQETILGSNPWVIDSLAITAVFDASTGSLSFPAVAGGIYRLEYTTVFSPFNWTDGGTYTAPADGTLTIDNLPQWNISPMVFYRVMWINPGN